MNVNIIYIYIYIYTYVICNVYILHSNMPYTERNISVYKYENSDIKIHPLHM